MIDNLKGQRNKYAKCIGPLCNGLDSVSNTMNLHDHTRAQKSSIATDANANKSLRKASGRFVPWNHGG